jgi:NADH:ubiquinone oxidoreductase subunit 6 (subunit J)
MSAEPSFFKGPGFVLVVVFATVAGVVPETVAFVVAVVEVFALVLAAGVVFVAGVVWARHQPEKLKRMQAARKIFFMIAKFWFLECEPVKFLFGFRFRKNDKQK